MDGWRSQETQEMFQTVVYVYSSQSDVLGDWDYNVFRANHLEVGTLTTIRIRCEHVTGLSSRRRSPAEVNSLCVSRGTLMIANFLAELRRDV